LIGSVGVVDSSSACRERVRQARSLAPRAVIGRLADVSGEALAELAQLGLTHVVAELGGATDVSHAFALPEAPTLGQLSSASRAARAHGVMPIVETPLTRSSAPSLAEVARIACEIPALAFVVRLPLHASSPAPSLPIAIGHARSALDLARRAGVFPLLIDAPRCLAGAYAPVTIRERVRTSAPACLVCAARESCAQVEPWALGVPLPGLSTDLPVPERAQTLGQLLAASRR
jgi:hypothetical protein